MTAHEDAAPTGGPLFARSGEFTAEVTELEDAWMVYIYEHDELVFQHVGEWQECVSYLRRLVAR